jgi:hypothetical protein
MKDMDHPFFRPLWRRVAVVVACVAWAGLELYGGSQTWGLIALGFAAYGACQFLWLYKPPKDDAADQPGSKE